MLQTMDRSSGNTVGYALVGTVTRADYATLDPAVAAAIKDHGTINLLLDLTQMRWENLGAISSDLDFGKTYKDSIDKMALVADAKWVKEAAKLAEQYYAKDVKSFEADGDAWDWITS